MMAFATLNPSRKLSSTNLAPFHDLSQKEQHHE